MSTITSHEPLAELNITPLIDVLLVLIVMFILCLPMATNELPIDLPGKAGPASDAPVHRLAIDRAGVVSWDGVEVGGAGLDARLRDIVRSGGQLTLASDALTRFEAVDRTLATIKRAGVTRLGFEGNERYAAF
ncbi:ExbD/TolR family protein [uncultured Sphingomonas sp.]|uniref:ExbD/TolR family protein n=1 Tax=uncultured Sphingomonas sp. TaxID=158754 RepID=UPI0035CAD701